MGSFPYVIRVFVVCRLTVRRECFFPVSHLGATTTEEDLPIQTVGHITGYCLGQTDAITAAHHSAWKTLHSGIAQAAPKGWEFPSEKGELTIGQLWDDNKMDEICTKDNL